MTWESFKRNRKQRLSLHQFFSQILELVEESGLPAPNLAGMLHARWSPIGWYVDITANLEMTAVRFSSQYSRWQLTPEDSYDKVKTTVREWSLAAKKELGL